MRRLVFLLATMALALLSASGVALAVTRIGTDGPDTLKGTVVGPGESIQKAVYAADPGDTIVVKGVHREDVVIRKNRIKLRGDDAVIEAPPRAKADSPCSRVFGTEAICVLGDDNTNTDKLEGSRVSDVSVSGFTIRGFKVAKAFVIDLTGARNATIVGNRVIGNVAKGIVASASIDTTVAWNHVIGNPETAEGIVVEASSHTTVVKNVVRNVPEGHNAIEAFDSTDTTIAGNDLVGNWVGVFVVDSPGTKILSNDMSRSGIVGTFVAGPKSANAKVVGNDISGGAWGMYVADTEGGSIAGNNVHDNCAGMFFEAFEDNGPKLISDFEVKANTVKDNTRSCRTARFDRNFSGIGIALLGARDMEVTANRLSGNVPSGPTPVSGGVVVATDPFFGGTIKPRNNAVTGNDFGRNRPDIRWDGTGTGNQFRPNNCDAIIPARLCR